MFGQSVLDTLARIGTRPRRITAISQSQPEDAVSAEMAQNTGIEPGIPPRISSDAESEPARPLSAGGQNLQRISMNAAPRVDTTYHGPPQPYSDPNQPLPEAVPNRYPRISLPDPRIAEADALYKKYTEPGTAQQNLARIQAESAANHDRGPERQKGALNWLKDTGRAGFRGFLHGGVAGAMGGLIRGAVDPQFANEAKYYERDLPRAEAQAQGERVDRTSNLKGLEDVSRISGRTPGGFETESAAERRIGQESIDEQRITNEELRKQPINNRGQEFREQAAKNHVVIAQSSGQPVDPAAVKGTTMEPYAGKVLPRIGTAGGAPPHFVPETGGRMIWDSQQGRMVPTPGAEGLPLAHDPNALTAAQQEAKHRSDENERQQQQARYETLQNRLGNLRTKRAERAAAIKEKLSGIDQKKRPVTYAEAKGAADAELREFDSQIEDLQGQTRANNPAKIAKRAAKAGSSAPTQPESPTAALEILKHYLSKPKNAPNRAAAIAAFKKAHPGVDPVQ